MRRPGEQPAVDASSRLAAADGPPRDPAAVLLLEAGLGEDQLSCAAAEAAGGSAGEGGSPPPREDIQF